MERVSVMSGLQKHPIVLTVHRGILGRIAKSVLFVITTGIVKMEKKAMEVACVKKDLIPRSSAVTALAAFLEVIVNTAVQEI